MRLPCFQGRLATQYSYIVSGRKPLFVFLFCVLYFCFLFCVCIYCLATHNILISLAKRRMPDPKSCCQKIILRKETSAMILFFASQEVWFWIIGELMMQFHSAAYLLKSCQLLVPSAPKSHCPWLQTIELSSSCHLYVCMSWQLNVNLP